MAARIEAELADLSKRRQNLLDQMEGHESTGDVDIDRDLRSRLTARYADVARQHTAKSEQLTALTTRPKEVPDDPSILDQLPVVTGADLMALPDEHRRELYDSFQLQVRYLADSHSVILRVTVREDRMPALRQAIDRATTADGQSVPLFVAPPTGFEPVSPP